jgi:RNA polymerase sigma-70 factor (ECF subfamily)
VLHYSGLGRTEREHRTPDIRFVITGDSQMGESLPKSLTTATDGETRSQLLVGSATDLSRKQIERETTSLYEQNAAALTRYAMAITRSWDIAQEAVQEAFLRYFIARLKGEVDPQSRSWLFRVAHNYVMDRLKDYYTRNGLELAKAKGVADPHSSLEDQIFLTEVADVALLVLSERELECLRLRSVGMCYKEIAEAMSIESGTVGALLARGLKKMRHAMGQDSG